jgi:hypothetical protein
MAKPKQKRLDDATAALQQAQKNLAHKQASLRKVRSAVCVKFTRLEIAHVHSVHAELLLIVVDAWC